MNNMLCVYHIADHDGKGSAAIVRNKYPKCDCIGVNHDTEIPYDKIRSYDKIVVCDFALPFSFMLELHKTKDFTWIDHHASVINEYNRLREEENYPELKGLRRVGTAAICLTWEYFHPKEEIPEGVILLGLSDIYDLRDKRVLPFEYAFQSLGVNRPEDEIWSKLFNGELDISSTVSKGEAILSWIEIRNYRLARGMAFASSYQGYKCICANMPQGKSKFFDSIPNIKDYDFMVNFYMNKENLWNLSFYTAKDDVDVSKIAASFGGGGHVKASGASSLSQLPEFLTSGTPIKL